MKKILFSTAVAVFLLIACKDATTTSSAMSDSTNEKNLADNNTVNKAIMTGDRATLDSFISNDAVDHMGPNGKEMDNGDSIKAMLADMHNHIKDMNMDVIAEASNKDYIFTFTRMTGTTTDSTMGMPAGTKIDSKGVDVVRIKDHKMVEHWGFVDPAEMMKQMHMDNKMESSK